MTDVETRSTTAEFVAQIMVGQHDDGLSDVMQAVVQRASTTYHRTRWRVRPSDAGITDGPLADLDVTEDDLTLAECRLIEKATRLTWAELNPMASAEIAGAILLVTLTNRSDIDRTEAAKLIGDLPAVKVADMVSTYFADPSPLDQQGTVDGAPLL